MISRLSFGISYSLLGDPLYVLITTLVLATLSIGCVLCERVVKSRDVKLRVRITLYSALAISCYILLYALPTSLLQCRVELIDDTVVIHYVGCGLELLGSTCTIKFDINDVINVSIVDWNTEDTCKPVYRVSGLSISSFLSGWFDTTCGRALILTSSRVNILLRLRDRDYVVILGPRETTALKKLLTFITGSPT